MILRGIQQAAFINTHRHRRQDRADPGLHPDPVLRLQARPVQRQFLRRRRHDRQALFEQVRATMLVTVFVFLGIEGASVYSRFAENAPDVGAATILGFVGVTCLMVAGHAAALRGAAARRDRRHAPALDGAGAGGGGRPLGRGVRQHRRAGLGARRLSRLVADLRRGAVRRRQVAGHAAAVRRARTATRCPSAALWATNIVVQLVRHHDLLVARRLPLHARPDQRDGAACPTCWWRATACCSRAAARPTRATPASAGAT